MYDDGVCGTEISSLPIDVRHLSMLYRYVDILTGDRMIVGISGSVRLATGFGGYMPSHSLVPVTAPRLGRDMSRLRILHNLTNRREG